MDFDYLKQKRILLVDDEQELLDMVSSIGRLAICTGTGNNGNQPLHEGGTLKQGQTRQIELSVSSREPTLNVQLWKSYEDEMSIYIENPSGNRIGPLDEKLVPQIASGDSGCWWTVFRNRYIIISGEW